MLGLFELTDEITKFNAQETVDFFKDLLRKEALLLGIALTDVSCPRDICVSDGGIDASATSSNGKLGDLIIDKSVRYQLKADNKNPWDKSTIIKEIFKDKLGVKEYEKLTTKEERVKRLKPSIKKCLDDKATYIYIAFKHKFVQKDIEATEQILKNCFDDCGYTESRIKVWGYEHLNNIIKEKFPVIALNIKGIESTSHFSLYDFVANKSDLRNEYFPDEKRESILSELRNVLNKFDLDDEDKKATHIRVIGASGIGKTKTVIEALRENELRENCIFFDSAEKFITSSFLQSVNPQSSFTLVVDECNKRYAEEIFNSIEYNYKNIKLITIYNTYSQDTNRVNHMFIVEKLNDETLSNSIVKDFPQIPEHIIKQIINLCEGFARVARIVAENWTITPEEYLKNLDDNWKKYISDNEAKDSLKTEEKLKLLEHLSLFERFGYKGTHQPEYDFIIKRFKEETEISDSNISGYIKELINRNILRGDGTLYISPRIFHNWLKTSWWEKHQAHFDYENFVNEMPPSLVNEFNTGLYEIDEAVKKKVLTSQFKSVGDFEYKTTLFYCMAHKNEKFAFNKFQDVILKTEESVLETSRNSLNHIIKWFAENSEYFQSSCDILFRLAYCEGKTYYSNNAKGLFASLFSIFYNCDMAETFTSLEEKRKYLENLYQKSLSIKQLEVMLGALAVAATDPTHLHKSSNSSPKSIIITSTKTQIEFTNIEYNYLSGIFALTTSILNEQSEEDLVNTCNEILLQKPFYLIQSDDTFEFAINHYEKISQNNKIDKLKLIRSFETSFKYNHFELSPENLQKLTAFYNDFKLVNKVNELQNICLNCYGLQKDTPEHTKLIELLKQDELKTSGNIDFLFTEKSKISFSVGYEQSLIDTNDESLNFILSKYEELGQPNNIEVILGYYWGLYQKNPLETEATILNIKDESLEYRLLPRIINVVQTDKTVTLLMNLIKSGIFKVTDLKLFNCDCSESVLTDVIDYLLSLNDEYSKGLIIQLIFYNRERIHFSEDLVVECLLSTVESIFSNNSNTDDYMWNELVKIYINEKIKGDIALELFKNIIQFNSRSTDRHMIESLSHIATIHPAKAWECFADILESDETNFVTLQFKFKEYWTSCLFNIFDKDLIIKWIDEDVDNRLYLIAKLSPDKFLPFADKPIYNFYRTLLIKYPQNENITKTLSVNSFSGMWMGKESENVQSIINQINNLLETETEQVVIAWLNNELSYNEHRLQRALEQEERFSEY